MKMNTTVIAGVAYTPIKTCKWRHVDNGMFGFHDYCWETECKQSYDVEKVIKSNYCPNCGGKITD